MSAALLDTSIYISAFRTGGAAPGLRSLEGNVAVWLSAVVLAEMFSGARDRRTTSSIEELERDFRKARRLLVPEASDWSIAGKAISRLGAKYDYEAAGRARLFNDVLIAVSAGRLGITVVTENARDFERIREVTQFEWRETLA